MDVVALLRSHLQDVPKPPRGEQPEPRAVALDDRVGHEGGAVHDVSDVPQAEAGRVQQVGQAREGPRSTGSSGGGEALVKVQPALHRVGKDEVGEGAARQSTPMRYRPRGLGMSHCPDQLHGRSGAPLARGRITRGSITRGSITGCADVPETRRGSNPRGPERARRSLRTARDGSAPIRRLPAAPFARSFAPLHRPPHPPSTLYQRSVARHGHRPGHAIGRASFTRRNACGSSGRRDSLRQPAVRLQGPGRERHTQRPGVIR